MVERSYPVHPMQAAELKLQELGIQHAPIQGFSEGPDVDGRYVGAWDEPGAYYVLGGVDNQRAMHKGNDGKIQLLFLQCPENAHQVADQIGWQVEKIEPLPSVGPVHVTLLMAMLSPALS
jgi:hypothetical protein